MKKTNASFDDFLKLDIRVGEIKEVKKVEKSNKLYELLVDFGADYGVVTILTGMQKYHAPEAFTGKKFLFLANLEPRAMAGSISNGMILSIDNNGAPILFEIPPTAENGLSVS